MAEERILVKVGGVYSKHDASDHFVRLEDVEGYRIRIPIGQCEAWAIASALEHEEVPRPLTHDAMLLCITTLGATVTEVYIHDWQDEVFYAILSLRVGEEIRTVDMRPSDALNLAVRVQCPVFISERVYRTGLRRSPTPPRA